MYREPRPQFIRHAVSRISIPYRKKKLGHSERAVTSFGEKRIYYVLWREIPFLQQQQVYWIIKKTKKAK
jgi:hypothetical protein